MGSSSYITNAKFVGHLYSRAFNFTNLNKKQRNSEIKWTADISGNTQYCIIFYFILLYTNVRFPISLIPWSNSFLTHIVQLGQQHTMIVKIGSWNIHGLSDKLEDDDFVNRISELDICFLLETWSQENFSLADSYVFSKHASKKIGKQGRKSGGISVIINKKFRKATKIYKETEYGIWIKLDKNVINSVTDLFICGVYIPPIDSSYSLKTPFDAIENDISELPPDCYTLLVGDFNARTGNLSDIIDNAPMPGVDIIPLHLNAINLSDRFNLDSTTKTYGRKLITCCKHSDMAIVNGRMLGDIPGNLTSYQSSGNSVIDYAIASHNMLDRINYFQVSPLSLYSDHCLIKTSIHLITKTHANTGNNSSDVLEPLPLKYKWNEIGKEKFIKTITSHEFKNKIIHLNSKNCNSPEEVYSLCDDITKLYQSAAEKSLKRVATKRRKVKNKYSFQENKDYRYLKDYINSLGKSLKLFPNDPIIRGNYFKAKKNFSRTLKKMKSRAKSDIMNKIDELQDKNPTSFWKLIKEVKQKKDLGDNIDPETFLSYFRDLHKSKPNKNFNNEFAKQIDTEIKNATSTIKIDDLDKEISSIELQKAALSLKNNKASGFDGISNEMIKHSLPILGGLLHKLFNLILKNEKFPKHWNDGFIIPIFKSGSIVDPANYRGITISNCLGKLLTKILNKRLTTLLTENGLLTNCQIGFLPKHRTSDHILLLKTIIDTFKRSRKTLFICFIDFKKAFDTVFRKGLIYKMMELNISTKFINLINSMYDDTKACIKGKEGLTKSFPIKVGTKQGCNLSPTLFNIFINDLPSLFIKKECYPIMLGTTPLTCMMYADDLVLFSKSEKGLINCLKEIEIYCSKWRLTINTNKTKIMTFNTPKKADYNFKIYNSKIETTDEYVYLGITFHKSGTFKKAIEELVRKGTRAYYSILKEFNFHNNTKVKTLLKLFDTMVKPILLYGCEIWGLFGWRCNTELSIKQYILNSKHLFEMVHIKMCKNALGVHKKASGLMSLAELGRLPLTYNIVTNIFNYWQHIYKAPSSSLLNITSKNLFEDDRKGRTNYYSRYKMLMTTIGKQNILKCEQRETTKKCKEVKHAISNIYENYFFETIDNKAGRSSSGGRFDLFSKVKTNYSFEKYLLLDNKIRRLITSIRISTHNLPIEFLRKCNIDRDMRICNCCSENKLGSEFHVLFECNNNDISNQRILLFNKLSQHCHQWNSLSAFNQFIYLVNAHDDTFNFYFAIYLDKVFRVVRNNYK